MVETEHGLIVFDWEYAAAAGLAYDLSVFSSKYKLGQAQLRLLLSA
jgi:thiamine kinase-like enzyme